MDVKSIVVKAVIGYFILTVIVVGSMIALTTDSLSLSLQFGGFLLIPLLLGILGYAFYQWSKYGYLSLPIKIGLILIFGTPLFSFWVALVFFAGESLSLLRVFIFICLLVYALILWWKFGKDPKVSYKRKYEAEPPFDYSPAIVGVLQNTANQTPRLDDFIATIFYFVNKKILKIDKILKKNTFLFFGKEVTDYEITFLKKGVSGLPDYDKEAYNILKSLSSNNKLTFSDVGKKLLHNKFEYKPKLKLWANMAKDGAYELGLFKPDWASLYFGLVFGIVFFTMLFFSMIPFVLVFGLQLIAMIVPIWTVMSRYFKCRSEKGALHIARWKSFKKYIEDHSDFAKKLPDHVKLWGKYMTYAVSMGVSENIMKTMGFNYSGKLKEKYVPESIFSMFKTTPKYYRSTFEAKLKKQFFKK